MVKIGDNLIGKNRGQITIFIIIAISIVLFLVIYFYFKGTIFPQNVPKDFEPVYSYYITCLKETTKEGTKILGMRGGHIENQDFIPGSIYMPFSSELDFLGVGVPYWYSISGNGIVKENVPRKEGMQDELNRFLENGILDCDFSDFEKKGYQIFVGVPNAQTKMENDAINVLVNQELIIKYENETWQAVKHDIDVESKFLNSFNLAKKIYEEQKAKMFLERYGLDILRLYAPVDGTLLSCSPGIWKVDEVRNNLTLALEANIPFIKIKGNYYRLNDKDDKYFVQDINENFNSNINFMYSSNWPMKFEVWPSENGLMKSDPVGLQEGLGILGFCYVPYHYVYDFLFPVMVQIYSGDEIFQFPIVVFINKNQPRKALDGSSIPEVVPELCKNKIKEISISAYDKDLIPIEAEIDYQCLNTNCYIGRIKISADSSSLNTKIPECFNGNIVARAEGYETEKYLVENTDNAMIVMKKKHKINIDVLKSGVETDDTAIISFTKDNKTMSYSYPLQKEIELSEGLYKIKIYLYSNSSISLKGFSNEKCVDVPKNSILGSIGFTEKKCFNMDIPDQIVTNAISGGGINYYFFNDFDLQNNNLLILNAEDFGILEGIEDLQENYNKIEMSFVDISLKMEALK